MSNPSNKLLDCEYDEAADAIRFMAEFDGVFGHGIVPVPDLAEVIGKPIGQSASEADFRQAVTDGLLCLDLYRTRLWTPWSVAPTARPRMRLGR